jgi:hypothetical protein
MSIQEDLPEIPRIPPPTLKALSRLCAGSDGNASRRIVEAPRLVDIGDDIFVIFTDGATAVLVQLDVEDDDFPELESGEDIQESFNGMLAAFNGPTSKTYYDVDVGQIVQWAAEKTKGCTKCEGKRTCMFPRLHTAAYTREDPDVFDLHGGYVNDAYLDRRRLQTPLSFLQVEDGYVDVVVISDSDVEEGKPLFCGVAILGDGWRIYTAGRSPDVDEGERPRLDLKK